MNFRVRESERCDLHDMMKVFLEISHRIPIDLSTRAKINALRTRVDQYLSDENSTSLTAMDPNGVVVGFQLATRVFYDEDEVYIDLAYVGISATAEGNGIFRRFVELEKQNNLQLRAHVKDANRAEMQTRLEKYGFVRGARLLSPTPGIDFRWPDYAPSRCLQKS